MTSRRLTVIGFVVAGVIIAVQAMLFINLRDARTRDIADARRAGGDSATAAVSTRYLRDLVTPLRDSLVAFRAKPVAGAELVVARAPVSVRDTARATLEAPIGVVAIYDPSPDSAPAVVPFATRWESGVAIAETLLVRPAPVPGTTYARTLRLTFDPDSLIVALLRLPDGTERFTAIARANDRLGITVRDAAIESRGTSLFSRVVTIGGYVACATTGIAAANQMWGVAAGAGATCGVAVIREVLRK